MRTWLAASGVLSVVFLSACGGGGISSGGAGDTVAPGVPTAPQTYTVSTKQYTVNAKSGSAPSVTMNVISVPGLPATGGIAVAKDGALWWETPVGDFSGEMVRVQGKNVMTVPFDPNTPGSPGVEMTATPDGLVWGSSGFEDGMGGFSDNYFAASAGSSSVIHNTPVAVGPDMISGPDGNMWFAGSVVHPPDSAAEVGNSAGFLKAFGNDDFVRFGPITVGPDKMLWVFAGTYADSPNAFYHYSTSGTLLGTVPLSRNVDTVVDDVTGPDGAIWAVGKDNFNNAEILRITTNGQETVYPYAASGVLGRITVGGDGALWFTDNAGNVGRITTSGSITLYPLPSGLAGEQITGPLTSPGCGNSELFVATVGGPVIQLIIKT